MRKLILLTSCFLLAAMTACSSDEPASTSTEQPKAEKKAEAPDYISGRSAFQKLYLSARAVANDIQPFRLQSGFVADAPTAQGKAGIWRGYFASPSKRESKAFTWSGVSGENIPE